jgi:putative tryptophan/tyrosine transport system substrate-binding protein
MLRREFITFVGGAVASPLVARAQQPKRRIGVLMATAEGDATGQARARAFLDGIQRLGWTDGRNVIVDIRWAAGNPDKYVTELLALAPEYSLSGKWLELLIEIAPNLTRIAVLRDPSLAAGIGQFAAVQALAPSSLGAELFPIDSRDPGVIEPAIAAFARERNGGLIVTASQSAVTHRNLIISLALRHRLPNIYGYRYYPENGGLASYGPDAIDMHSRAAEYVDRILKGEKPADLPVQAPTKYELVVNLKTAKSINVTVPRTVLDRADEVIE